MRPVKIASVVLALHLIVLAFFFFKPPANYFLVICLSTATVWSAVFALGKGRKRAAIIAGALLQLAIQQVTSHAWLAAQTGVWWPLAQFIALQYLVALRLDPSSEDA